MTKDGLKPHDLVAATDEQLTHKMIARAIKGRRLTPRVMWKVLGALNAASGKTYELADLFDYAPEPTPEGDGETHLSSENEGSYACPNCGESITVPVPMDGEEQEYVEDCPVCCSPMLLRISVDEDGGVRITAQAE
jgi:hypothetical protein